MTPWLYEIQRRFIDLWIGIHLAIQPELSAIREIGHGTDYFMIACSATGSIIRPLQNNPHVQLASLFWYPRTTETEAI